MNLEEADIETGRNLVSPFYLLKDSSMIRDYLFRDSDDYQYAGLNVETFERVQKYLITRERIESDRLIAQLDHSSNAMHWHAQRVDDLWQVSKVRSLDDYLAGKLSFLGYLSGDSVRGILPNTYQRFQSKRTELRLEQDEFEKKMNSLRPAFVGEAPF